VNRKVGVDARQIEQQVAVSEKRLTAFAKLSNPFDAALADFPERLDDE
jgi:hypothetical protein